MSVLGEKNNSIPIKDDMVATIIRIIFNLTSFGLLPYVSEY